MFFTDPAWVDFPIKHGFFGRQGGVSQSIYQSLNCGLGSEDDTKAVRRNRDIVLEALGLSNVALMTAHQVHSTKVQIIDDTFIQSLTVQPPKVDAFVTQSTGVAIGILAADCLPVLFVDPQEKIIGAAHAGWKGALNGVLESTLQAMVNLGTDIKHCYACLGPCIGPQSYEVRQDFYNQFLNQSDDYQSFFQSQGNGFYLFDLAAFAYYRLIQAGLKFVHHLQRDTKAEEEMFFSYRRSCLRKEPDYGRQLSVISLC